MPDDPTLPEEPPILLYRPSAPLSVTVVENRRLTSSACPSDVHHLVVRFGEGDFSYVEGQSVGIIAPGLNVRGRPNAPRLYSVASDRLGEDSTGTTLALTVKRARWTDSEGRAQQGLSSSYLCDAAVGDVLPMTGPVGREILPPRLHTDPVLMIATGTGIAPFRAFMRRRRRVPVSQRGPAVLVFGVRTYDELLYRDEWFELAQEDPGFRFVYALSREQSTSSGERMYVHERIKELADFAWSFVTDPRATVYVCGIRGMEAGIDQAMSQMARPRGVEWPALKAEREQLGRWRVETY